MREGGKLKNPVLPYGANGRSVQVVLAGSPTPGVEGEEAIDESSELGNIVGAAE